MLENIWIIPFIPAVSFVLIMLLGKRLPRGGSEIGVVSVASTFVLSIVAASQWINRVNDAIGAAIHHEPEAGAEAEHAVGGGIGLGQMIFARAEEGAAEFVKPVINTITWWQSGSVEFTVGTHVDGLTVMMLFVVSFISMLVHIYSLEYVKGDIRFTHFFGFLSLFTASMMFLLVAENTLQMLVGWELVGLCSFALIGHWWQEKPNSDAALKAFLTNRVGDVGLIVGVITLYFATDSFNIIEINTLAASGAVRHLLLLVAACSLMAAVMSKSGQFPLHTWLPDAMAGPTPVSALIHAATMVVAGVFMIARLYPVFFEGLSIGSSSINLMAFIGGFTTIIGAGLAFVQKDIKKVLAYSTISQLGYMVMALGVGAWNAALFHLFTHAFFKACLFLGAGSLSHAAHHSFNMVDDYGGLKKRMPTTFWTFTLSSLALAGIAPFAGFWSKDEILGGAFNGQGDQYTFIFIMGCATAFMTAAYMTRAIWYCFFNGEYKGEGTPHESPKLMTVPLIILSVFAVGAGAFNLPAKIGSFSLPDTVALRFEHYIFPEGAPFFPHLEVAGFSLYLAGFSLLLAVSGIVASYLFFFRGMGPHGITERSKIAKAGHTFLLNKYYLDHLYTGIIAMGTKGPIARAVNWFNKNVLDGVVDGVGKGAVSTGRMVYDSIDQKLVDGAVNGAGTTASGAGGALRGVIQTGKIQNYAALLFISTAAFGLVFLIIV